MKGWLIALLGALVLAGLSVGLWLLGVETTSQLLWILALIAFLWGAVELSLLLRPHAPSRSRGTHRRPIVRSWSGRKSFLERFAPGASLPSGTYNAHDEHVWDGNKNRPGYNDLE